MNKILKKSGEWKEFEKAADELGDVLDKIDWSKVPSQEEQLGLDKKYEDRKNGFRDIYGLWTQEEFEEFEKATKESRVVDTRDWE